MYPPPPPQDEYKMRYNCPPPVFTALTNVFLVSEQLIVQVVSCVFGFCCFLLRE
jgi:hypothetical protein